MQQVTHVPVGLRGQHAHGLGGAGPTHETAAFQVHHAAPPSAPLPEQLLNGQGLDHGLSRAHIEDLGGVLATQLQAQVHGVSLLGDGGERGLVQGAVTEMSVFQRADVLCHPAWGDRGRRRGEEAN